MPYQNDLIYNEEEEVEGQEDVVLPGFAHHTKIRSEIQKLVEKDCISAVEGDQLYEEWKQS